jgi:hypothetical protein
LYRKFELAFLRAAIEMRVEEACSKYSTPLRIVICPFGVRKERSPAPVIKEPPPLVATRRGIGCSRRRKLLRVYLLLVK